MGSFYHLTHIFVGKLKIMHVYFRYWLKKTQLSISSCSDRITSYSSFAITYISKMNRIKYTNRWLLNSLFSSLLSRLLTSNSERSSICTNTLSSVGVCGWIAGRSIISSIFHQAHTRIYIFSKLPVAKFLTHFICAISKC